MKKITFNFDGFADEKPGGTSEKRCHDPLTPVSPIREIKSSDISEYDGATALSLSESKSEPNGQSTRLELKLAEHLGLSEANSFRPIPGRAAQAP